MLGMRDAALIGISTPLGSDNWLTAAVNLRDKNGLPYFPVIQLGLVCQNCIATGHIDVMNQCEHMKGLTPPWKAEDRADRMREIASAIDDSARALREGAGVIVDSNTHSFDLLKIKRWFENTPMIETTQYPDKIYVAVDPDAGGERTSSCAVVSGYRLKSTNTKYPHMTFVITGLESRSTNSHLDQQVLVLSHIRKLRQNPRFRDVPIVFIPEVGTGFQHTHLEQAVSTDAACYTIHEKNGPNPGIRKTHELTQNYMMATMDCIESMNFILEETWVTTSGFKGSRSMLLEEFKAQLTRYGRDEKGKLSGKGGGRFKDDLTIAFMMVIYWSRILEQPVGSNPYIEFLNNIEAHQALIRQGKVVFRPFDTRQFNEGLLPSEAPKKNRPDRDIVNRYGKRTRNLEDDDGDQS